MDVVVVGAGVVGLAVARELARDGAGVRLLEQTGPGTGTSGTSFAWVNANDKTPDGYFRLNAMGFDAHRELADEVPAAEWWRPTGHLQWALPGAPHQRLSNACERMSALGYPVERLTAAEARRLVPGMLLPSEVEQVVSFPREGHVHVALLLARLLADLRAAGGRLLRERVAELVPVGDDVAVRLADGRELAADAVVVCAGRWTPSLLATAGCHVPVQEYAGPGSAVVGHLAVTSPVPALLDRVLTTPFLNVRPHGGGRLQLQALDTDATADPSAPPGPSSALARTLLERLKRVLGDTAAASIESLDVGWRVLPADRLTVAGFADHARRIYCVATHSGVTLAPLLGRLATAEVLHGRPQAALEDFRPGRFHPGAPLPELVPARFPGQQ